MPARAKRNILLVEDDPDESLFLKERLEHSGYRVSVAEGGEEAINRISVETTDLLILDVIMPELNGFTVCERIRSKEKYRHIPVIFISAKRSKEDLRRAKEFEAAAYLLKPFSSENLLKHIARTLGNRPVKKKKLKRQKSPRKAPPIRRKKR